jgi:hypothetical protein
VPSGSITLLPLTTYHVLLQAGSDSHYRWKTLSLFNKDQAGPGTISDSVTTYFNTNPGTATNNIPRMAIEGVAVPEASGGVLMAVAGCAGVLGVGLRRRGTVGC